MSVSAYLRRAATMGLTLEQAAELAEAMEVAQAPKRSSAAARQARYRDARNERDVTRDAQSDVTDLSEGSRGSFSPTPPNPPNPPNLSKVPPIVPQIRASKATISAAFEQFWGPYPRKVGKGAAERAFPKALAIADLETLIAAARAYAAKVADVEVGLIKHPSGWLNDKRWLDAPDPPEGGASSVIDLADFDAKRAARTREIEAAIAQEATQ